MKSYKKIFLWGLLVGVLLAIIQNVLNIEEAVFRKYYILLGLGAIVLAGLVYIVYNRIQLKKIRSLVHLFEEGKTDEFIYELEKIRRTAKGQFLKDLLDVNIAAGMLDKKNFQKAINLMERVPEKRIKSLIVKMVRNLNLSFAYFFNGQDGLGYELYNKTKKEREPFKQSSSYAGNIALLDVLGTLYEGDVQRAREDFLIAKEKYAFGKIADDYALVEKKIEKALAK